MNMAKQRSIYPPIQPGVRPSARGVIAWLAVPVVVGAVCWWLAITLVQIGCQAASAGSGSGRIAL